jgi:hypothetical protein
MIKLAEVSDEVKVKDGKLFFADTEAECCDFIKEDSVAALYVVRVGEDNGFVTGLDLVGKRFWLGSCTLKMWKDRDQLSLPSGMYDNFSKIKYILDNLCDDTAGKKWRIFEESNFDE